MTATVFDRRCLNAVAAMHTAEPEAGTCMWHAFNQRDRDHAQVEEAEWGRAAGYGIDAMPVDQDQRGPLHRTGVHSCALAEKS